MDAITLWQPWAWAIAHAGKNVENRTWAPPARIVGQTIAIHAAARACDDEALCGLYEIGGLLTDAEISGDECVADLRAQGLGHTVVPMPDGDALPRGAVVAVARIARVERLGVGRVRSMPWYAGPVGWVLDQVRAIEPVPCRGAQGLWRLPADVEAEVRRRIPVAVVCGTPSTDPRTTRALDEMATAASRLLARAARHAK